MGNYPHFYYANLFETATITASSGSSEDNTLDNKPYTYWASEGSNDSTSETLIYELPYDVESDTVLLIGNNCKAGNIQYWNGSAYVNFSTPASWTSNKENRRFEYTAVSFKKLRVTLTTTEIANTEKRVAMVVVTKKMFELAVPPEKVTPIRRSRIDMVRNDSGLIIGAHTKRGNAVYQISFKNLGSSGSETDFVNLTALEESRGEFMLLLCGDTEQVRTPYTWGDIKKCIIVDTEISNPLSAGVHSAGDDYAITVEEID